MILPFSTHWPKTMPKHLAEKLTLFPEKVLESLKNQIVFYYHDYHDGEMPLGIKQNDDIPEIEFVNPKHHTIREDKNDRWKEGNDIHFSINVRTKNQFQFAPVVKCVSTQKVEIVNVARVKTPYTFKASPVRMVQVIIDGKCLTEEQIQELAINDGFDTLDDFFAWFDTDFTGKIIHWTDLKY